MISPWICECYPYVRKRNHLECQMRRVISVVAVFLIATSSLLNAGSVGARLDSATVEEMVLTIVEDEKLELPY